MGAVTYLWYCGCRRFDIVLLLLDQHEPNWDCIVSQHVLANHQEVGRSASGGKLSST